MLNVLKLITTGLKTVTYLKSNIHLSEKRWFLHSEMQMFIYRKIRLLVQLHIQHIKIVLQQTKATKTATTTTRRKATKKSKTKKTINFWQKLPWFE